MKDKKLDVVRMMREIRNRLGKKYSEDQEVEEKDLQDIRGKYGIKSDSFHDIARKGSIPHRSEVVVP